MHGIQTSGNCIRNITSDALAGIAPDEVVDPRPYCEILRQWSTLHPEFAFLPRKFKIAVTGAREDRAAIGWHDIGLQLLKNDAGEVGFKVLVGGGMGRTPIIGSVIGEFVPWQQILVYIEAIVRVYNRYGRRDNLYKARIKILVKAEGQKFVDAVNAEFRHILEHDRRRRRAHHSAGRARPRGRQLPAARRHRRAPQRRRRRGRLADAPAGLHAAGSSATCTRHKLPAYRAVTLSLKRAGQAPGDVTGDQMDRAAELADALQPRRAARHARPEPAAALGARGRAARAVAGRARSRLRHAEHRPADRHDRLPRRRLLRAGQRALDSGGRGHHRALRRPRRALRHRRHRPAHQRLHQQLRPPPQRPHRHPRRRQGRRRVVPDHARRLGRQHAQRRRHAGQGDRPVLRRRRGARRHRGGDRHLPPRARSR